MGATSDITNVDFCGLDPTFSSCLKLYVSDIIQLPEIPSNPGIYCYNGHFFVGVDIVGVVVTKIVRDKLIIYAVDDGTGIIACSCWRTPHPDQVNAICHLEASTALREKVSQLRACRQLAESGCVIGSLLHVRGNLCTYNGVREIRATHFAVVDEPNVETVHMEQVRDLYQRCYDQPVHLPSNIVIRSADSKLKVRSIQSVKDAVLEQLHSRDIGCISLALSCKERMALVGENVLDDTVWRDVIAQLHAEGHVFQHHCDTGQYIVTCASEKLKHSVLQIMSDYLDSNQGSSGCHFLHIFALLQKKALFKQLTKVALQRCLTQLESNSDIISTAYQYYVVIS